MNTEAGPELYTQQEAAKYLRCAPSTLWRHERAGRIKPIRLSSRKLLYPRAMLDRILESWEVVKE